MSAFPIYVWIPSDAARQPESIEDVGSILTDLLDRSRDLTNVPINPERLTAFAGLAKALKRNFPIDEESGEEAFWDRDLLLDAKATKGFVFFLEPPSDALPPEQLMRVLWRSALDRRVWW